MVKGGKSWFSKINDCSFEKKKSMKIRRILPVVLLAQLMMACCNEPTYLITITGIESRALIFDQDNQAIEFDSQNPIGKDELLIDIRFIEKEKIASIEFGSSKRRSDKIQRAAVVPCGDQIVIYNNNIESIKVEVFDPNNDFERIDVTDQLVIQGTQTSISDYITQNPQGSGGFLFEFSDTSNIPDRIEYLIEATLDDGTKISTQSGLILFN